MSEKITEDMIGCLCEFSDISGGHKELDILEDIELDKNNYYYKQKYNGYWSPKCRPVKPDEVKFYNHIGDTNEKVGEENKKLRADIISLKYELTTKCSILEKENKRLKQRLNDSLELLNRRQL